MSTKTRSLPFIALCIVTIFGCESKQESTPRQAVMTSQQSTPKFDRVSAYNYLKKQTDFGPRNPNSIGHQKCLTFLAGELQSFCDKVELQSFSANGYNETLHLTNIFASINPTSLQRILLIAHWDTRPRADHDPIPTNRSKPILGANDGASGVAVLLEMARVLKGVPPSIGVDFLLTDGEDYGDSQKDGNDDMYFLGAKHFAKTKPKSYLPVFGILLDMVGDRDLHLPMEYHSMQYAPHVVDKVWSKAEELGKVQFVRVPGDAISDDHLALNQAGIPTIDIIDFDYPYWHTLQDTPDKCSAESLEAVGSVMISLIYSIDKSE